MLKNAVQVFLIVLHCGRSSEVTLAQVLTQLIQINIFKNVPERVQWNCWGGTYDRAPHIEVHPWGARSYGWVNFEWLNFETGMIEW